MSVFGNCCYYAAAGNDIQTPDGAIAICSVPFKINNTPPYPPPNKLSASTDQSLRHS